MTKQVLEERSKNKHLQSSYDDLQTHAHNLEHLIGKLEMELKRQTEQLSSAAGYAAASRSLSEAIADRDVQKHFNLPDTEFVITSFSCMWGFTHGWLYLTPGFVCFDSYLFPSGENCITIPITSILSLSRPKMFQFLPSTSVQIVAKMDDQIKQFRFHGFARPYTVISNIVAQSDKFNHSIATD